MKPTRTITLIVALTGALALPALAAGEDRVPPGDLAIWIFLGFCALIVLAQLVPLARALLKKKEVADHAEVASEPVEQAENH